jgi:hypothetical protein
VKSFLEGIGKKVEEAGELLERNSPLIKTKLAEMGRSAKTQASAAKEVLEQKSSQAQEIARQVIDSPKGRAISDSITSGITSFKESVSKVTTPASSHQDGSVDEKTRLENAIAKLDSRDKIGVSTEVLTAAGGAAAGAAAAGTIAGAAGATTLLGSTGLASLFGGIFVTTTPIGWVIGSAVIAGAAGYGLMKMARSGAQQDTVRREMIERLTHRLSLLQSQSTDQLPIDELKQLVVLTLASNLISDEQGRRLIDLVEKGTMNPSIAINRLKSLALDAGVIEEAHSAT